MKFKSTLLCGIAALTAAPPAFAQDTAASTRKAAPTSTASSIPGDIVVTARRREESLQKVPVAVTVLSAEKLAENRITNVSDLTTQAPSLHINTQNRRDNPIIAIRGLRQSDVLLGQDSAVGFYINEVAFSYTPGINQGMFDVQSIQVLKGAQGTLFGRNATGGAILVTTQKPSDKAGDYALIGFDGFGHGIGGEAEAAFNLPINEKIQLRVAGRVVSREGYVENTADRGGSYFVSPFVGGPTRFHKADDERSEAARATLRLLPIDGVTNDTVVQYSRIRENGTPFIISSVNPNGFAELVYGPLLNQAFDRIQSRKDFWSYETNQNGSGDTRSMMVSNTSTAELGAITLKNIFGFRHVKVRDFQDFDGTALPILETANIANVKELSDEVQAQATIAGSGSLVAGAYYYRQTGLTDDRNGAFGSSGGTFSEGGTVHNTSKAVFAQATVPLLFITDKLSLTAGGRYSWDNRRAVVHPYVLETGQCLYVDENGNTPSNANCFIPGKVSYKTPTWTDGLDYKVDPNTLIYFTNRRGFRSGGFNLRATAADQYAPFKPEKVTDYEIGLKRIWQTGVGRVRTNVALFHTQYRDVQRYVVTDPILNVTTVINAASAHVNGAEAEVDWQVTPKFNISGFYSFVDAKYDKFVTGSGDFTSNKFAQIPKHSGSATMRWTLPIATDVGELVLQGNVYYQSTVWFNDVEQSLAFGPYSSDRQKGYALVNGRLELNHVLGSSAALSIYVNNLLNKKYYAHGVNLYQTLGLSVKTQGDPRVVGMSLKTSF
jgi:iron complex outermembrane receptor protein